MKKQGTGKRKLFQWIIVAEIIVCYMAVLTVVSYARGPERHGAAEEPLLTEADFSDISGLPAEEAGAPFTFEDRVQGETVGCLADVDLRAMRGICVSFSVDCPAEYAGGVLFVDLCNGEAGYDYPEQEYQLTLLPGQNEADFILDPGPEHPDTAALRFFTLDTAGYRLENVGIYEEILLPQIPDGLKIGVGACFLLLAVTAAAWAADVRRDKRSRETGISAMPLEE